MASRAASAGVAHGVSHWSVFETSRSPVGLRLGSLGRQGPPLSHSLSLAPWVAWLRRHQVEASAATPGMLAVPTAPRRPLPVATVLAVEPSAASCSPWRAWPMHPPLPPAEDLSLGTGCSPLIGCPLPGPRESQARHLLQAEGLDGIRSSSLGSAGETGSLSPGWASPWWFWTPLAAPQEGSTAGRGWSLLGEEQDP